MGPLLQQDDDTTTIGEATDWLTDSGITIGGIIIFAVIAVIVLNALVPRAVRVATEARLEGKPQDEIDKRARTLTHVFTRSGSVLIVLLAFFTILPELGINIGPLLAGLGIAGIAVGFGAQSLVRDIIAGIFILTDNQYGRGDVVRVADVTGLVEDVGLRRTVLRDLDGIVHYIPNGEITVASNFTQEFSRVNLDVSVSYAEDLDHVMSVINRVGQELAEDEDWGPLVITPPKALRVNDLGDSGIDIKIVGDTQPIKQWEVMGELRRRLKRTFDEEGIEIPFPHRVQVTNAKAARPREAPPEKLPAGKPKDGPKPGDKTELPEPDEGD